MWNQKGIRIKIVVFLFSILETMGSEWDYSSGSHGPSNWGGDCQSGSKQSPIDLVYSSTTYDSSLGEFTFTKYDVTDTYTTMKNNGHAIQVDMSATDVKISGGGLANGDYTLAQFHFHWGSDSNKGSEHYLDSAQCPLEVGDLSRQSLTPIYMQHVNTGNCIIDVHFVHWNNAFTDISDAVNETNGLAVLGFMFETQASDNTDLDFLVNDIDQILYKDNSTALTIATKPAIDSILGSVNLTKYIRYSGSLTTPDCYESVQWTVFTETIKISEAQLGKFREAYLDTTGTTLIGSNYRPLQALNSRPLKSSYELPTASVGSTITTTALLHLFFLVTACLLG